MAMPTGSRSIRTATDRSPKARTDVQAVADVRPVGRVERHSSLDYAQNDFTYCLRMPLNASLGPTSPTRQDRRLRVRASGNLDLSRVFTQSDSTATRWACVGEP